MLRYYLRLALKSFGRTPGLTALMAGAMAFGIAACIVTLTVYHTMSGNPIWWKNDVLYAVTMDSWDPKGAYDPSQPTLPPDQLTYRDATYLAASSIPRRKTLFTIIEGALSGAPGQSVPLSVFTGATTADFFRMFDVPFEYGGPWSTAADQGPEPLIVLSQRENDKLFGGADSVGRTLLWNNLRFRVVGVMSDWRPQPKFYNLTGGGNGNFGTPEDAFIPFQWGVTLQRWPGGTVMGCWGSGPLDTYRQLLSSECIWITMWVELPTAGSRVRFLDFMNAYWAQQRGMGRFPRPRNNRLWKPSQWLAIHRVVSNDSRLLVRLAFAFLAVCLINTVGILLAKFLRGAAITGIRRALGASRRQIFAQHLAEVALLSLVGSLLGVGLGALGLRGVQAMYDGHGDYGAAAHFDPQGILWALALAALSTLIAGLYPAWRIGRVAPAAYLKSQ